MKMPGEELVIKMWDSFVDKGIVGVLRPIQEKRLSNARRDIRREELLALAQAEVDVKKIAAGEAIYCGNGRIKSLTSHGEQDSPIDGRMEPYIGDISIYTLASSAQTGEAIQKEVNIAKAIIYAEEELVECDAYATDRNIEKDWLFAWRGHAEKVCSEELQSLWGRVLAGEVKEPGTFSLRTMDFLKTLTKTEAQLIEKVAGYIISDGIFRKLDKYLEEQGVNFSDFLFLQSIGLISGVEAVSLSLTISNTAPEKFTNYLIGVDKIIILHDPDATKKIKVEAYSVTALGKEIFKLSGASTDSDFLHKAAQYLLEKVEQVFIADYKILEDGSGRYFNEVEITID